MLRRSALANTVGVELPLWRLARYRRRQPLPCLQEAGAVPHSECAGVDSVDADVRALAMTHAA